MEQNFLGDAEQHMQRSLEVLSQGLTSIRTGRANPSLIQHLTVEYYGAPTPLQQLAAITSPEPRQLIVQPYDRSVIASVDKAIRQSELGLNPTNEGTLLRIVIPTLTEERRRDLVKLVHKRVEESKVAIRNVRRDTIDRLRRMKKDREIREDEEVRAQEELQKLTDRFIREADGIGRAKESEILEF